MFAQNWFLAQGIACTIIFRFQFHCYTIFYRSVLCTGQSLSQDWVNIQCWNVWIFCDKIIYVHHENVAWAASDLQSTWLPYSVLIILVGNYLDGHLMELISLPFRAGS